MKRWTVRVFLGLVVLAVGIVVLLAVILNTGTADRWARSYIIKKLGKQHRRANGASLVSFQPSRIDR